MCLGRGGDRLKKDGLDHLEERVGGWMSAHLLSLHLFISLAQRIFIHMIHGLIPQGITIPACNMQARCVNIRTLHIFTPITRQTCKDFFLFSVHFNVSGGHTC